MKKVFFILSLFFCASLARTQDYNLGISYIGQMPIIDGHPDESSSTGDWQTFSDIEKTNEQNQNVSVRYKIAYNQNYLYLIIESGSDSILCRDRAYQNGDGFHLVIAKPDTSGETNEFYVLRFSPENKAKAIPEKKGIWYYNTELSGKSLSGRTQFETDTFNGKSYFELLLPWEEIYPYNPFFSDGIGINLCFVKAIGEKEKNYYFIKYDERIQSELSKRKYAHVSFAPIPDNTKGFTVAMAERRNIQAGDSLKLKFVSYSSITKNNSYSIAIRTADNYVLADNYQEFELLPGMNVNELLVPVDALEAGGYKITWKSSDNSDGEFALTILPAMNYEKCKNELDMARALITDGDYYTYVFRLNSIMDHYKTVKPYETAGYIREAYSDFQEELNKLTKGNNPLQEKRGTYRRAFLSAIDTTLQPYSIKLPADYDASKKYALLVMLHGSGSTDEDMLGGTSLTENNFIEIAPYGRGTSNCFTMDSAQFDVKEAIDDVIRNFSIDTSKIILAGFSMGGYGAYRIFYEFPKLFKGIAVFSGHPCLASKWIGPGYPDFLEDKYLEPFKNIPVFIYHNKNDLNCPYDLTVQLVAKLKAHGSDVTFISTETGGHGLIDSNNQKKYFEWLDILTKTNS